MKITGIKHKAGDGVNEALRKIGVAGKKSDVVFAPDYALAHDLDRPNTISEYKAISERLNMLSMDMRSEVVFAGTMPVAVNGQMELVCPIVSRFGFAERFQKETDRGESKLAESHGLVYSRGDCNENNYDFGDRGNISVAICSDHGHQTVPENTFLEAILAYDQRAGFWMDVNTKKFPRHIVVCDSYAPKVEGFFFDNNGKLNIWKPVHETEDYRTYELK